MTLKYAMIIVGWETNTQHMEHCLIGFVMMQKYTFSRTSLVLQII